MAAEHIYYTLQDIERYLNGSMTPQEMHELEKAALTDPLLADAIDGYSNANKAATARHLNEIAALLNKQETGEAVVIPMATVKYNWWRWAAAAGIMGILGFSAWLLMHSGDQQAETIAKADTEIARADTVDRVAADNNNTIVPDTNAHKPIVDVPVLANTPSPPFTAKPNQPNAAMVQGAAATQEKASAAASITELHAPPTTLGDELVVGFSKQKQSPITGSTIMSSPVQEQTERIRVATTASVARTSDEAKPAFSGKITDNTGNPLRGVSVISGSLATLTNANGSFHLNVPEPVDSLNIHIIATGYENENATLFAGRTAGIALQPGQAGLNEVVVVGYGTKKKKAELGNYSQLKVEKLEQTEYPFPDGGWAHFYKELSEELGVNETHANKLLHIRFYVEDGEPTDFTVVKTPDLAIAEKAITAIKKGPKWKNYRKSKKAEIKIRIE